jgi:hypothetical protein
MTTAATSLLGLALPVTGELSGTWGDTVNNSITALLDSAVAGTTTLSADADVTLTTTTLAANQAREAIILWTAGGTVTRNITAPAQSKTYVVLNKTSSTQSIVLRGVGPTTGVTILAGKQAMVAWDGTDFVEVSSGYVDGPASSTDNAVARFDGTDGKTIQNSVVIIADTTGNMSGVGTLGVGAITTTGALVGAASQDAFNTVSTTLNLGGAATTLNIGAATGTLTVANTTLAAKAITASTTLGVTGVTTLSNLTASQAVFTDASKNLVSNAITGTGNVVMSTSPTLVTPALGTPSALVGTNITGTATNFTASNVTTNANLTGAVTSVGNATLLGSFTSLQLATALTDETGTGANVFATSPTLVTPALGTPSSGVVTNLTGTASININGTVGATTANTGAFTTLTTSSTVTLNGGTANGVAYLNGSKVLTTGSALTFDGTNFSTTGNIVAGAGAGIGTARIDIGNASGNGIARLNFLGVNVNYYNWSVGSNDLTNNSLTFTPSTTIGGSTFTTPALSLTSSGNLGLGVTPSAWNRPAIEVGVAGAGITRESRTLVLTSNAYIDAGGWKYAATAGAGRYDNAVGQHIWFSAASGTAGAAITFTQAMTLDASGNLGIGTTSPASRLHAQSTSGTIGTLDGSGTTTGAADTGAGLMFNGSDGSVGRNFVQIGGYKENSTVSNYASYFAVQTRAAGGALTERMRLASSGIVTMSAYGAGAATFSAAGVISSVSDETWKIKDGVPVDTDAMLKKLEPGYWYYNDEKKETFGSDRQLGFYAQNVNAAIGPEAAPVPEEGKPWAIMTALF